jgi:nucleotide sugar dehydrogenase
MHISVIGSGYVGTVVAACFAFLGHEVLGVEVDPGRLAMLEEGHAPFHEPGLDALLTDQVASGRLAFTGDVGQAASGADVVFLSVGTPSGPNGNPDLTALDAAVRALGKSLTDPTVIVTKSTVPIGTNQWVHALIEDEMSGRGLTGISVPMVANPEFLRVGTAIEDFLHPDRIVVGTDDPTARATMRTLYQPILDQAFPRPSPAPRDVTVAYVETALSTAELIKYASNSFLAMKISFINEIAQICDRVGADVTQVAEAMGMDHRISPKFLRAGLGWGGSCFGKDLTALATTAREHGFEPPLLQAIGAVNDYQRLEVVRKLQSHLGTLRGKRVALLGLAFKPDTDDTRDAPATQIATKLGQLGAVVIGHDPVVTSLPDAGQLRILPDPYEAVERADAAVIITEWPQFAALDLDRMAELMHGNLIIDGRNILNPANAIRAGFVYEGIGRGGTLGSPRRRVSDV